MSFFIDFEGQQLELVYLGGVFYHGTEIPVLQLATEYKGAYSAPIVRFQDIPAGLREKFLDCLGPAAMPFQDAVFSYDFINFLARFKHTREYQEESLRAEPEAFLAHWAIVEVSGRHHFTGRRTDRDCVRITTEIVEFDFSARRGRTRSGRVYHLAGNPGMNEQDIADLNCIQSDWTDVTDQFIANSGQLNS